MSRPVPEIRPATERDAEILAPMLSDADRAEVLALSGREPLESLLEGIRYSAEAWTGLVDGEIVCIWGVVPQTLIGQVGVPWMLGSDLVRHYSVPFLRRNKPMIARWRQRWPVLRNVVDARHARAIRWLRWLGFEIGPPVPIGRNGEPFHIFTMRA